MWTRRERAMLKAMGKTIKDYGPKRFSYLANDAIRSAVRAAREINEPDYRGAWQELLKYFTPATDEVEEMILDKMAEIERRHRGKA